MSRSDYKPGVFMPIILSGIFVLGFLIAVVLKIAQGSSTVAMIIGSSMVAAIVAGKPLDFNLVYVATAIGGGSLVGSWMNDSGFWILTQFSGIDVKTGYRVYTLGTMVVGSFAALLVYVATFIV